MSGEQKIRAAVVGASGYVGAEVVRLLLGHPRVALTALVAHSRAGEPVDKVLPSLAGLRSEPMQTFDAQRIREQADVVFCALPHRASAPTVAQLRALGLVVLDLSADFRLRDREVHKQWYGEDHAPELVGESVYGLVELHREALLKADLIAVPGCFPTGANLVLAPLVRAGLITTRGLVVDAKSGVSGAGRKPSPATHLPEAAEGVRAYKVGRGHRHVAEIEQEMSALSGEPVHAVFTPHLVPMTRGILSSAYVRVNDPDVSAAQCSDAAREFFAGSPFVVVLEDGQCPDTLWVRGTNRVHLSYTRDQGSDLLLAQAAIDNLVKGAAGQAVQCLNVRFGFEEDEGLRAVALWP